MHRPLFNILQQQNVPDGYLHLLALLYRGQKGSINGKDLIDTQRGVKQGDTLSAMLFNAAIQEAFVQWKMKLTSEGWLLKANCERLTNVRYADDILLFAKSREELQNMLLLLVEELRKIGLELNADKTKILTNEILEEQSVSVGGTEIGLIAENGKHKYLGRYLPGVFENRSIIEVAHRIQCGWHKFGRHSSTLLNKNVSIKLRLKLFDAVVTPSILFGLHVLPISGKNMTKITGCQNKMLRKIVGWSWHSGDNWETVMSSMKRKVMNAMQQHHVRPWNTCIDTMRSEKFSRLRSMDQSRWEYLCLQWVPQLVEDNSQEYFAHRDRGRPLLRWYINGV